MPASDTYGVFYTHPQLDGQHFADTGKEKFNDTVMVEVFIMGSKSASISKPVYDKNGDPIEVNGETYMQKYPKAWAAFSRDDGTQIEGTMLKNMGGLGPGQIMNLNAKGIETIEDLADLNDGVVIGEHGMLDLRKRAQAYMASINPEEAQAEKNRLEGDVEELTRKVEQLQEALQNQKKPRGRPKKA